MQSVIIASVFLALSILAMEISIIFNTKKNKFLDGLLLLVFAVCIISSAYFGISAHNESSEKRYQEKKAEFALQLDKYLEEKGSIVTDEVIIKGFNMNSSNQLTIELLIQTDEHWNKVETLEFEETSTVDKPVLEYIQFEEDLVYRNKGNIRIINLKLPEGYLSENVN